MNEQRQELQKVLSLYILDIFTDMKTIRRFCINFNEWKEDRETESDRMRDITVRADHVKQSKSKGNAFLEFMKSKFTSADSKYAELEKELAEVLNDTLEGLEKLHCFLEAVEKLAVTSLHVFADNQVLHLPEEIKPSRVQAVIKAARLICPLLLEFKRDAKVFFLPKLQNVEVMVYQLDRYIQIADNICEEMEKSCISDFCLNMTEADLDEGLSEYDTKAMLDHINQLNKIKMDQDFRMAFLFPEILCYVFINKFKERQPRMLKFLSELEESAVQLDRMNKGAKISSVAGSSVGAVGGVLSIVGLALTPVTAGVSLGLTVAGVGLGVTSGANSIVTTATELGVNHAQQKKAGGLFQSFMEDVESLQEYLDEVTKQPAANVEPSKVDVAVGVGRIASKGCTVGKGIDSLVDAASAIKVLKNENLVSAGKVAAQEVKALRNVPRVASDIPDIGQAAAKGPLALTKGARVGFIVANGLFLGMDLIFICKDSISLARGSETKVSQFIRARSTLWRSEMDSWEKIRNSLHQSQMIRDENRAMLDRPFYLGETFKKELEKVLCSYASDTLTDINTMREFCENFPKWKEERKTESDRMRDIKVRADQTELEFSHITESKSKVKAFQTSADRKYAELEKELAEVLNDTLEGLEKLHCFLEAVEKLAVTSLHVFADNQVLHLPEEIKPSHVQAVIKAARLICPLLLEFKRDAKVFFLPKLQNVEVMVYQLDRYIQIADNICEEMEKSCISDFCLTMTRADLDEGLSERDIQTMFDHIYQLNKIKMDQNFRMVLLFPEKFCQDFIKQFKERQPKMLKFLKELEESAVQLDEMSKGSKIFSGAVGGVLPPVGLALIPVAGIKMGASLALTMTGLRRRVISGDNSIITIATEVEVTDEQKKKAKGVFQSFMEDVESLQKCLDEVTKQPAANVGQSKVDEVVGVVRITSDCAVGKGTDSLADATSAAKLLENEKILVSAGKKEASDIPDVIQAAVKGPLVVTKEARAFFITAHALFLGMDVFLICKDSVSLARGSETKVSQFIRDRAALWRSEIKSWKKIRNSLCQSRMLREKKRAMLEKPFYPGESM